MTMVMVEEKERRRVKAAGVQVILPEMFQRRVAGPHKSHDQSMPLGRLPDIGTFRVISLASQPLSHAFLLQISFLSLLYNTSRARDTCALPRFSYLASIQLVLTHVAAPPLCMTHMDY